MSDDKQTAWDDAHSLGIALRLAQAQNRELRKQLADSTSEVSRKFQDGICHDCESPDLCIQDNGCHNTGKVFSRNDHPSQQWQPIETVPRDGTEVIVVDVDGNRFIASSTDGHNLCDGFYPIDHPTHWMSMPEPPTQNEEQL